MQWAGDHPTGAASGKCELPARVPQSLLQSTSGADVFHFLPALGSSPFDHLYRRWRRSGIGFQYSVGYFDRTKWLWRVQWLTAVKQFS